MSDGVRLSATLTIPIPKQTDEKFPVLLEYKPYRKDDNFYNYNQPNIYYLVRRGFIVAKVDIRGTGSSEGILIEHEYTSQELDDCERVIEQLAAHSQSNGRVGMYGLSWSAFNSLMMATLRRPPALRAILAAHGSEDLYKNDIHFMDGILHQDEYILSVDHENALPTTPDYVMDEQWIKERFTRRPWIDVYLEHQLDSPFWRKHSIKYAYDNLTVPAYLLAGLDFAINIYENARKSSSKIKVVIGPFVHAMPEYSYRNPGPGYDGKAEMVSATAHLAHWIVRLEDIDIDSQVWLVTGAALNGAQRETPPAYLEPNHLYKIRLQLHFTTWTFLPGHRIRVAISNAMFPAFWPSPFSMNTSLYLNPLATFIGLPIIPSLPSAPPSPPPLFTQQQIPVDDIIPDLFSGGEVLAARNYDTNFDRTVINEQISYDLLPNGRFMSALLAQNFSCSRLNPADVRWTAVARHVYVFDIHGYTSIDDVPMKNDEEIAVYPDVDLSTRRHFELTTELTCYSDQDYFYVNLKRQLFNRMGTKNEVPLTFVFSGKHKRQFQ
ncbi:unnamed protein product [Rotaria sp. Silwood2]|nr:unnamed protein product [Rotaria sp. Silwood2]CAF3965803.1 unnamed protein product [Rotaria sp. Silwood2]